ncbi:MAG: hypothetical protein A2W61_04740 [Deltaproteobacteria bacterium RIFCSPLOWO2_01_44_7]|nr:MAG: hypothetical protein A2712_08670 [Deltaproteobacteria bacterium RIFCSPHIGHO2_01_FULL_43_49]OGQ14590.1 MAG: hypothetical protein A3D22_08330 [Deltaproteobacteria bacterium RIFCSPHIGHO2_02_FULL_44_53]OGQ27976.1 MAG: hypothetical protein A3D98_07040 [Deltaproteobacteria bacterium RIFCSPHIGHO2_12_FULL_44_21]OGQ31188.1 MAG: hypothetical protein A2979_07090 [Deltaproteobacteria bacterium RIFCSPLOWO2_01_FULL_45_74]OGQ42726.1 MAG: hypothetical protein A2W61_04740 [Deltaproteobacteria bacterium 
MQMTINDEERKICEASNRECSKKRVFAEIVLIRFAKEYPQFFKRKHILLFIEEAKQDDYAKEILRILRDRNPALFLSPNN